MGQDDPRGFRVRGVQRLLEPRSIVIVGFSMKPGSGGRNCLDTLVGGGFAGDIHLVGRSGGEFEGRTVFTDIAQIPTGVDLAVLNVPAAAVKESVAQCIAQKVAAGVVFASGFAELGDTARQEQDEISTMAQAGGLALVGPNCMGFTNYLTRMSVSFMPVRLPDKLADTGRTVAIVTQSGGLMAHFHQGLTARRIPVAYRISTGNEVSLGLTDFVDHFADDPKVNVVVAYAEHIREPQEFLRAVAKVRAMGKALVLLHTGRGEGAKKAAVSHTGALASDYQSMFVHVSRAGALVVETLEELLDVTELLVRFPVPPTKGLGVMTTSGAICSLSHDYCDEIGLDVAKLTAASQNALALRLPTYVVAQNPLDLTTQVMWDDALVGDCAAALVADPEVGSVCIVIPASDLTRGMKWLNSLIPLFRQPKPVILTLLGDQANLLPPYEAMARDAGMVLSRSPERSMRTLARVTEYGRSGTPAALTVGHEGKATEPGLETGAVLPEWKGKKVLAARGIAVPAGALAQTQEEAVAIADRIGYPVVAKVQAPELAHKTEVGGVVLGIADPAAVRQAWTQLQDRMAHSCPGVKLDGILIESMSAKGLELMVGAKRDPQWGPTVMVGLGGIWVEILKDVRLMPAGMDKPAIGRELNMLRTRGLLDGYRGAAALDASAVIDVVDAVGRLMLAQPSIQEIDINPLMVTQKGAVALDALISTAMAGTAPAH
jgi:acetate---CoA ligase (ADP-forming)